MLKSVLLALDGIADHRAAVETAIFLARRHGAAVHVLLTLDLARIEEPEAYGVGGAARHEHLEEILAERLRGGLNRLRPEVEHLLGAAGLNGHVTVYEGDAEHHVILEAQRHDLLLLSASLRRRRDEDAVELDYALRTQRLIEEAPVPIMLVDRVALGEGAVAAAYDASSGAARALHALLNLGLVENRPLHILSVAGDGPSAERTAEVGASLAARYGIAAETRSLAGHNPGEAVLAEIARMRPALLVMGAYGRRTWREWLFGATTTALLDQAECPILVTH